MPSNEEKDDFGMSKGTEKAHIFFFIWHCDSTVVFRSIPLAFPQESSDASVNNAMYHTIILVTLSFIIKE